MTNAGDSGAKRPLRLATYNIEWFNALFDDRGRLLEDRELSARYQTTRADQLGAIAIVLTAMNADGVMIIEGPDQGSKRSTVKALEGFARHFGLRTRKAVHGFASETEQEIAFLYDPDRIHARHEPMGEPALSGGAPGAPRFDTMLRADLDLDGVAEQIRFSKPPLELAITADGTPLRLIGVHAKSKAPHGQMPQAQFIRISIENRRKQLAECQWLRRRIDSHLAAGASVIVLGDLNDGPGLDEYEKLFGHSGVEIVLGLNSGAEMHLYDPHAHMALAQKTGISPTTARFWLAPQKRYFEALLDFIMVSPDLAARSPDWRIWHPFNDPAVMAIPELRDALLTASDHFPVTIDLEIN
jgi:endonuclease/exonuclease/phosphatase family metal-dependent hydrolase